MHVYVVPSGCKGIDELRRFERPEPQPGPGQVLIRVRATSLNYRDQMVIAGTYFRGAVNRDTIPLSDGAGEVTATGAGVTRFKPGDRVAGAFFQIRPDGPPTATRSALGAPLDGTLAEQMVLYEDGVVAFPKHLSFEEAACLPCAAVTAWNALFHAGRSVKTGETVLTLGTGGVSMFALQFAKAAGARVIATSSTDEKLERVKAFGASDVINYKRTPEWDAEVLKVTGGRGVDCVVEVGGAGTLGRSFQSLAAGGKVGLIGVLTGRSGDINPYTLMFKGGNLHGIFVGTREMFEQMNAAIELHEIRPVIDKVFPFEEAAAAYRHHASGNFMGKVAIRI